MREVSVLDVGYLQQIHTMCQAFVDGYDKVIENRTTRSGRRRTKAPKRSSISRCPIWKRASRKNSSFGQFI
ncbi:MAG: hypothetical protein ABIP06_10865 [Pyrinomonadaceae bacterium]